MLSRYQDEKYLLSFVSIYGGIGIDNEDSCQEIKELFLDIVQNYSKKESFRYYLKDISDFAEDSETKNSRKWNDFKLVFGQYDKLIENCIISKIFANCINDDMDEMIMSFQIVITEYVMIKYSAFLRWLINEEVKIDYEDIRNYIVIYSRIIDYNTDGIMGFWEDSFDGAVWELGYLLLLIN
jgi:lysine-N-methylase